MVEKIEKKVVAKETKKASKKTEVKPITKKATNYPIRGNVFEGEVISAKAQGTITVQRQLTHYVSKYERYKKVYSKIKAHVPQGVEVKEGDKVRIGETRKISKTKNFILMEVLK